MAGRGEAGGVGPDHREDLQVLFEPGGAGPELDIRSTVGEERAREMAEKVRRFLGQAGVTGGRLAIRDQGAPDHVLRARLEWALDRARPEAAPAQPPPRPPAGLPDPPRERLRRSRLYVPGDRPRLLAKALATGSDGVILDLEDAVAPAAREEARLLVRNALAAVDFGPAERMVRINQGEAGRADLAALVPQLPDLLLLPKVENAAQVVQVDRAIRAIQAQRPVWLMPIVESAAGILAAREIAAASDRVAALAVGLEDLTADLGAVHTGEGRETFTARSLVVLGARAAGVQPIDTVFSDFRDEKGLRRSVTEAKALGFEGKGCIHPAQVGPVNEGFTPGREELERALRITAAYEKAAAAGSGVVALGSRMVDAPVVARARRLVEQARRLGLL